MSYYGAQQLQDIRTLDWIILRTQCGSIQFAQAEMVRPAADVACAQPNSPGNRVNGRISGRSQMTSHLYDYLGGVRCPGKYIFDVRVTVVVLVRNGVGESQVRCRERLVAVYLDLAVFELGFIGVDSVLG